MLNRDFTLPLILTYKTGAETEYEFTHHVRFRYAPSVEKLPSGGLKASWNEVMPDPDENASEAHCRALYDRYAPEARSVSLFEAIGIFREDLYGMCLDNIQRGNDIPHWRDLRRKLESGKTDKIEYARSVPITGLVEKTCGRIRTGFVRCPFHDEKTASLKVYPKSNTWWCYGCGRGGSAIDWVMHVGKCSFMEAVNILS